jgi:Ser/Thr protein kinase RdoA (MazF antagonist)
MEASGRALAALHAIRDATAPELRVVDLTREVGRQLDVVEPVWPQIADQVRSLLDRVGLDGNGLAAVLCHGDFTPSQVLLSGDTVCGVVDFDTVCWGEEAMDLGRFVAHLDLLVTKEHGESATPIRQRLADRFLAGYADSAALPDPGEPFLRRVDAFRSLSLASTALHACRQLKERRMRLALSLLDLSTSTAHYRPGKAFHDHLV